MLDPSQRVGKIYIGLFHYFDAVKKEMDVKKRPLLIVGFETQGDSPLNVDYEVMVISTMSNTTPTLYDIPLMEEKRSTVGLNSDSYLRTHKINWIHARNLRIERSVGDLKYHYYDDFQQAVLKNEEWVFSRNEHATQLNE